MPLSDLPSHNCRVVLLHSRICQSAFRTGICDSFLLFLYLAIHPCTACGTFLIEYCSRFFCLQTFSCTHISTPHPLSNPKHPVSIISPYGAAKCISPISPIPRSIPLFAIIALLGPVTTISATSDGTSLI